MSCVVTAAMTANLVLRLIDAFPGLKDGETPVDGGDLTAWLSDHVERINIHEAKAAVESILHEEFIGEDFVRSQ